MSTLNTSVCFFDKHNVSKGAEKVLNQPKYASIDGKRQALVRSERSI